LHINFHKFPIPWLSKSHHKELYWLLQSDTSNLAKPISTPAGSRLPAGQTICEPCKVTRAEVRHAAPSQHQLVKLRSFEVLPQQIKAHCSNWAQEISIVPTPLPLPNVSDNLPNRRKRPNIHLC